MGKVLFQMNVQLSCGFATCTMEREIDFLPPVDSVFWIKEDLYTEVFDIWYDCQNNKYIVNLGKENGGESFYNLSGWSKKDEDTCLYLKDAGFEVIYIKRKSK